MLSLDAIGAVGAKELYAHLRRDFAAGEYAPEFAIRSCLKKGVIKAFYLIEDHSVLGYAAINPNDELGFKMICYMAIVPDRRGKGYGSKLVSMIDDVFPQLDSIVEVEDPSLAKDEHEAIERSKRIAFYERNGFRALSARYRIFGVEMILMRSGTKAIDDIKALMHGLYRKQLVFTQALRHVKVENP
ncbi:MAG: GNAT family N-acetyltransferase [Clostridiales bacterium]|nr:GNAT family N-acetyltransferase [Clostridiales bacterium]